jgi:pimeloyl-ACP methyl ester carboxylesterase
MERYDDDRKRLSELAKTPVLLMWAPEDNVFLIEYANRLKQLLPHPERPILFDRAGHFLQDDRGSDIVAAMIPFLERALKGLR